MSKKALRKKQRRKRKQLLKEVENGKEKRK